MRLTTTLCVLLPIFLNAQIKAYPIDSWHSKIEFSVKFSGLLPVKGQFNDFEGTILLDEKDITKTSATLLINTNSIDTGISLRDNHLKGEDFFEVERHPQIRFSSTKTILEENQNIMIGNLSIHGIDKEIKVPVELLHGEQLDTWKNFRITLKGESKVKRSDFNVGKDQPAIGEIVTIEFIISARIFNVETIALFNRPFGKTMIKAILEGGKENGYSQYKSLIENEDKDAIKLSSFEHLYQYFKQKNNLIASIKTAELVVDIFPEESTAHSILGDAYFQNKLYAKAKLSFAKAMTYNEQDTFANEMLKLLN